ncbi:MAG: AAA family ATPase, partial [Endomicrobiales bacterium]
MAFVVGPRQVGKTTTCKNAFKNSVYINWDNMSDRVRITNGPQAVADNMGLAEIRTGKLPILFDEIHKYSKWKDFLKGFFDVYADKTLITVTGSAKLDAYKRGGDSLMGRYFFYRMHPLSVAELVNTQFTEKEIRAPQKITKKEFDTLFQFGGFPEPYLKANTRFSNRWKRLREDQLIKEDIRNLTKISESDHVQILAKLITASAG